MQQKQEEGCRYACPIDLIDLGAVCYTKGRKGSKGKSTSGSSYSKQDQWAELQEESPYKVISPSTAFISQALIGRSIYVLPMEWWYSRFSSKRNYGYDADDNEDEDDEGKDDDYFDGMKDSII